MSESYLDLGYTSPDDAVRYRRMREDSHKKPLTPSQENWRKNQNARDEEVDHDRRKRRPMLEPDAKALGDMSDEDKAEIIGNIHKAKAALEAAKTGLSHLVEVEQQPVPTEPVQEQLPFDQ